MKKTILIGLLMLTVMVTIFNGCSNINKENNSNTLNKPEYITEIPDNKFTQSLSMPTKGTPDYIIDNTENDNYSIFFKDITFIESKDYFNSLLNSGFSKIQYTEENGVIGSLIKKDNISVSVSISEGVLGLMITIE